MTDEKKTTGLAGAEVVLQMPVDDSKARKSTDSPQKASAPPRCPSPEIARFSPSPNKPPQIPTTETLTRRKSLARSVYSKPKSRFGEQPVPLDSSVLDEQLDQILTSPGHDLSNRASPNHKLSSTGTLKESFEMVTVTPKTPLMPSPGGVRGEDEEEEIYRKVSTQNKLKYRRVKMKVLVKWVFFICILGCLVASLTVDEFQRFTIWGLKLWKWCVLVVVTFCGMLVTNWFMHVIVFLVERNFLFRKKVLYFVHGLKKSVQVCIWLCLVLVTWILLFKQGVERSATGNRILDYVTWTIVSLLIGSFLWLLKTLLLKILASSFHVNTFFDRIQESLFHQYILQTLSGRPVMESVGLVGRTNSASHLSFRRKKKAKDGKDKEMIDIYKLHKLKQEKVSAWTMKVLVDVISTSGLSTISNALEESADDGEGEHADKEITNEMEAIAAAYYIFMNVSLPNSKVIEEMDLKRFLIKEEVDYLIPLIARADTGQIDKNSLTDWVVR